tara:strand:+ start:222 stop:902 length:681 start_codon:yes stop_codon:yes gene_type:complete
MNLGDLVFLARTRLRDKVHPHLWSTDELVDFANAAVDEAAERSRLISTAVPLAIVSGTTIYKIPYQVLAAQNATFVDTDSGQITPVVAVSEQELWALQRIAPLATGRPQAFARGKDVNTIELYPMPDLLGVGALTVAIKRMPTEDERMLTMQDEPAIPSDFHRDLVYWMLYEAFSIPDSDLLNVGASEKAESRFDLRFGRRLSAKAEALSRRVLVGESMYPRRFGG